MDIEQTIEQQARNDGQYAIAYALNSIARQLRHLGGTGDIITGHTTLQTLACTQEAISKSLVEIAEAIENHETGE